MSDNIQQPETEEEKGDTKTLEEKFKGFVDKIRPYKDRLWSVRKKFLIVNFVVLILAIAYLLFLAKPYYKSTVTILPEYGSKSSSMLSQFSGLASIVGVRVGDSAPTEIYQTLISSETVLEEVIYRKYLTKAFRDSVNLIDYFEIDAEDDNPSIQLRKNFLVLQKILVEHRIKSNIDRMTKTLNINVTMPEAQLSADVANAIVNSLDLYIRTQRKSYATEQSFYLEKRTKEVKDSLVVAENTLMDFREQNRITSQSPKLLLEQGRLMRNVEILQTVYVELTKQLEISKIDQIKDAPVLNVEEYAKNPVFKEGPRRASLLVIIMFFSFFISSIYYLFKDSLLRYFKLLKS